MPKNRFQRSMKRIILILNDKKLVFDLDQKENLIKSKKAIQMEINKIKYSKDKACKVSTNKTKTEQNELIEESKLKQNNAKTADSNIELKCEDPTFQPFSSEYSNEFDSIFNDDEDQDIFDELYEVLFDC